MDKPAVIDGQYVDAKFMRGLKVMRVMIDIPIEYSNEFIKMFGAPDGVNPVPVAVARLQTGAYAPDVPEKPQPVAKDSQATSGAVEPKRERRLSEIAAIKCADREFQQWMRWNFQHLWREVPLCDDKPNATATLLLKNMLGINSRSELDEPESPKALAFKSLLTDFDMRSHVR